jgi:hypothetical protein
MTGASITVTKVVPQMSKSLIYFTATLDGSAKADFSDYSAVDFISVRDASTLAPEDATAYTAGGDITFTNGNNVIKGIALVTL